jgi:hypothetical protein
MLETLKVTPAKAEIAASLTAILDGDGWLLAMDADNVGRDQKWYNAPQAGAKPITVPNVIQETFPRYHGVTWYWKDFVAPVNPHKEGRYLIRFELVDYKADVWMNGVFVGSHETADGAFVLDMTEAAKPGEENLLAVRVLNPRHEPINGIILNETPHRTKAYPSTPGLDSNHGGIEDSVSLMMVPAVYISDLYVIPNPQTGMIQLETAVKNTRNESVESDLQFAVSTDRFGQLIILKQERHRFEPGDTILPSQVKVDNPRLWDIDDPFLYRVTARISEDSSESFGEFSTRCGFRDFRFEDGWFRLNGRRIFLKCSHTGNSLPIYIHRPHAPDLLNRDILNCKMMGFNAIRFISGVAFRNNLDYCDEIGLLVYEEPYAAWGLADSDKMKYRYDLSLSEMIRRDRNHPSIVIWGLLNESGDSPVFRHAVQSLELVRSLDITRLVFLNSGRFDNVNTIGSLSNPGSYVWEDVLTDAHPYLRVPHRANEINMFRNFGAPEKHYFVSEYGIGSGNNLARMMRLYQQYNGTHAEEYDLLRGYLDRFMNDWNNWKLEQAFIDAEDFFIQSLSRMAGQRKLGWNAIRANPNIVGYSMTGTVDGFTNNAEGPTTVFRELKPGTVDALFDSMAPLRLCLFAEPANIYRASPIKLDVVLANEDVLKPGKYLLRLQVVGPENLRIFNRTIEVEVPAAVKGKEPPLAYPVFSEDVVIDGPTGKYRFLTRFEEGAGAFGGDIEFYVADPADMPSVDAEVVLWGEDAHLEKWLKENGIATRKFNPAVTDRREMILVSRIPQAPGGAEAFRDLATRIAKGSSVVFLAPAVFAGEGNSTRWAPLKNKGRVDNIPRWLYLSDDWSKKHPIFDGLQSGALMDYTIYRDIIPNEVWYEQQLPTEAVAGSIHTSCGYSSGLLLSVHEFGAGRFILNTLWIRENLGNVPVAERLLRNMLNYATANLNQPPAPLPDNFAITLKDMGLQ